MAVAIVALAAGFGQFGLTATLGDVSRHFGHVVQGSTVADRAGLSGTELGLGLAVVRLASLGGLPLAGLADRIGRRRVMLVACGIGLAITAASAASPGYWWFVLLFALGRPFLSAAAAVAQVQAAEQTDSSQRAAAVALVAAGYAVGAGATAVIYGLFGKALNFQGILLLALVPLIALPWVARKVSEPDRFVVAVATKERRLPIIGPVARPYRTRLAIVSGVAFSLALITGPATSFLFIYAQNIEHFPGTAISGHGRRSRDSRLRRPPRRPVAGRPSGPATDGSRGDPLDRRGQHPLLQRRHVRAGGWVCHRHRRRGDFRSGRWRLRE